MSGEAVTTEATMVTKGQTLEMGTVTPKFCTHVHGAKSKGDVHFFGRQHDHGLFFFSFFYTTFSHSHGGIVINDESMMNYVT